MSYRIHDLPAVPLLLLLHLIFTVSSLFLRIYELLTTPDAEGDLSEEHDRLAVSTSTTSPVRRKEINPPKHVGMVVSSTEGPVNQRQLQLQLGEEVQRKSWTGEQRMKMVECVLNLVELAAEEGVSEVSVYERSGLLEAVKAEIVAELQYLPPSPPMSEAHTLHSGHVTPVEELHEVDGKHRSGTAGSEQSQPVTTLTVFPSSEYTDRTSGRRITIHLLAPSASDIVATVASDMQKRSITASALTPGMLDAEIRDALHFNRDPDLLIVHNLDEISGWKSWLPRPAPELGGYPFWALRITEIYHHPPVLPLLTVLKPLLHLARSSTLPFLRKLGRLVPPPPHVRNEMLDLYDGSGRIGREEWEGAMRAWAAVEQRLGR